MKTLTHFRTHDDRYFHWHPLHAMFALMASAMLAVLMLLILVVSAS
jgi:hypothetical protein